MRTFQIPDAFIEICNQNKIDCNEILLEYINKYISEFQVAKQEAISDASLKKIISKVKFVILDVDGVLTDGKMYMGLYETLKGFHSLDGFAIKASIRSGIGVGIITAHKSNAVQIRAGMLGIKDLYMGYENKEVAYNLLKQSNNLNDQNICYVGDDILDIPLMGKAGFPVAVNNAVKEVKSISRYVTSLNGGSGAVREVIEKILVEQNLWKTILKHFKKN